ncbi:MAG TPA: phosphatidylinositol mannoside acyltransferase [Actinomycetales bacterium]
MSRLRDRAAERATLGLYRLGWTAVRRLPERAAYRLFDGVADLAWWRHGTGVRRLEANLARVRPGLDPAGMRRLSRDGMRSYLRYWCDSFRLPDWDEQRIVGSVRVVGDEPVRATLAAGRGVVMFLGHLGNWDHAGAWSTVRLAPVTTVAERLHPVELFDQFVAFREQLGMTVVPLGDAGVFRRLGGALRAGGFVPLLADRDLTDGGVEVQLFGEPARVAVGPAALALQTGAALHPVGIHYERLLPPRGTGWGIVITWYDEVPAVQRQGTGSAATRAAVRAMTQSCVDALAVAIDEHPQDWHMLQRVFTVDLEPRPSGGRR